MTIEIQKCTGKTVRCLLIFSLALFSVNLTSRYSRANPHPIHSATLTQAKGKIQIFSHPSKTLAGVLKTSETGTSDGTSTGPRVLYDGEYYQVHDAQIGDSVENGNIIRTAPNARARLIYPNGDQINIASGSAYRVFWDQPNAPDEGQPKGKIAQNTATTRINLMYGKLRGIIQKGGPRSQLLIKTKSAVIGVRGTDFFVLGEGLQGKTKVSTIRGSVEVTPTTPNATPIEVKAGYSADVAPLPASTKLGSLQPQQPQDSGISPAVELRKTTQEELVAIQKSSTIPIKKGQTEANPTPTAILELEEKAKQATLGDIRLTDPELYSLFQKKPKATLAELNKASIRTLLKTAPQGHKNQKPNANELEDVGDGAYEKYFKNID